MGILAALVFVPLLAMVAVLALPNRGRAAYRIALSIPLLQLAAFLVGVLPAFVERLPYVQARGLRFLMLERLPWLNLELGGGGELQIELAFGLDGLNVLMVLLTLIVLAVATFASRDVAKRPSAYFALLLLLNTSLLGSFLALDLFVFYLFYEFMLLPLFFLVGVWGSARGPFAAFKFFLYTLLGSVFMLLVIVGLYHSTIDPVLTAVKLGFAEGRAGVTSGMVTRVQEMLAEGNIAPNGMVHSFSFLSISDPANLVPGSIFTEQTARLWAFGAMFFAFAVKLPMVPIHTWLPDAHVEASTPISVILAGILLKVGGYGLFRLCWGLFPDAALAMAWWAGLFGVISILYGALNAMAQRDLKRMIAYSSVSHMGFVLLGLAAMQGDAANGAMYQLFTHGIVSSGLFLLAGVLYHRTGDRQIIHFEGLWQKMPIYTTFVIIFFFAGMGMPGFAPFVSEILVFAGAFAAESVLGTIPRWMSIAAILGIVLSAVYFLRVIRRMFFGAYRTTGGEAYDDALTDLTRAEWFELAPLAILALVGGVLPHLFLNLADETISQWLGGLLAIAR